MYQNENGHKVFLEFSANAPIRQQDSIQSVQWTTPWVNFSGDDVVVGPIPPDTEHGYFSFTANITITKRDYDPDTDKWVGKPVTLSESRERIMAFDTEIVQLDEWFNTERGSYKLGGHILVDNPPNWFDDRPGHWGSVVPNMDKKEGNDYTLHFATVRSVASTPDGIYPVGAKFDWKGELAPSNDPAYRGRVYVFVTALYQAAVKTMLEQKSSTSTLL